MAGLVASLQRAGEFPATAVAAGLQSVPAGVGVVTLKQIAGGMEAVAVAITLRGDEPLHELVHGAARLAAACAALPDVVLTLDGCRFAASAPGSSGGGEVDIRDATGAVWRGVAQCAAAASRWVASASERRRREGREEGVAGAAAWMAVIPAAVASIVFPVAEAAVLAAELLPTGAGRQAAAITASLLAAVDGVAHMASQAPFLHASLAPLCDAVGCAVGALLAAGYRASRGRSDAAIASVVVDAPVDWPMTPAIERVAGVCDGSLHALLSARHYGTSALPGADAVAAALVPAIADPSSGGGGGDGTSGSPSLLALMVQADAAAVAAAGSRPAPKGKSKEARAVGGGPSKLAIVDVAVVNVAAARIATMTATLRAITCPQLPPRCSGRPLSTHHTLGSAPRAFTARLAIRAVCDVCAMLTDVQRLHEAGLTPRWMVALATGALGLVEALVLAHGGQLTPHVDGLFNPLARWHASVSARGPTAAAIPAWAHVALLHACTHTWTAIASALPVTVTNGTAVALLHFITLHHAQALAPHTDAKPAAPLPSPPAAASALAACVRAGWWLMSDAVRLAVEKVAMEAVAPAASAPLSLPHVRVKPISDAEQADEGDMLAVPHLDDDEGISGGWAGRRGARYHAQQGRKKARVDTAVDVSSIAAAAAAVKEGAAATRAHAAAADAADDASAGAPVAAWAAAASVSVRSAVGTLLVACLSVPWAGGKPSPCSAELSAVLRASCGYGTVARTHYAPPTASVDAWPTAWAHAARLAAAVTVSDGGGAAAATVAALLPQSQALMQATAASHPVVAEGPHETLTPPSHLPQTPSDGPLAPPPATTVSVAAPAPVPAATWLPAPPPPTTSQPPAIPAVSTPFTVAAVPSARSVVGGVQPEEELDDLPDIV